MGLKLGNRRIEREFVLLLISIYTFLKIYRNSINYTEKMQGGIWNYALVFLVAFCSLTLLVHRTKRLDLTIQIAIVYAACIWMNGLLTFSIDGISGIYYYVVAPCFVPLLIFFYYSSEQEAKSNYRLWDISWIAIFLLLLYSYINYFTSYQYYQSAEIIALNNSYYAACSIPYFIRKRNKFGYSMAVCAIVIVFISNKRAGLIAVALSLVALYLVNSRMSDSFRKALKRTILGVVVVLALLFALRYIDSHYDLNIFSRLFQVVSDGGSGRTEIYRYVWNEIAKSDLFSLLFGHGVASVNSLSMQLSSAHNDFLNVFYEYGLFAMILLVAFYYSLFRCLRMMIKRKYENSDVFACSVVMSLFFSLFAANLDNQSFSIILATYWGIEIGKWQDLQNTIALNG